MNAQHAMAPVHECGLEAALQQMSKCLERIRGRVAEHGAQVSSQRPLRMRDVFASDPELRVVK